MTAPDARQSDELREVLTEALAERLHPRSGMSERAVVRLADALLPVVTAWAEKQARARAALELRELAYRHPNGASPAVLNARADALGADDRTDPA